MSAAKHRRRQPRFDAVGWVVIVLAVGIAGSLFSLVWDDARGISQEGAALLQPVFTGIVGVLGAYIGVTKGNNDKDNPDAPQLPPDTTPEDGGIPWPPPSPPTRDRK